MSGLLSDLLNLERKLDGVRYSNKFPPHTSAASCMYDRRLLDDEAWLSAYTVPVVSFLTFSFNCFKYNVSLALYG